MTINVQIPVIDDYYPGDDGRLRRVYIPAGRPAHDRRPRRSSTPGRATARRTSTAAPRQQRVILSLRQQADFATIVLPDVPELVARPKSAIKTDFPVTKLPQLIALADRIDIANVRSYVFTPPFYADGASFGRSAGYVIVPEGRRHPAGGPNAFTCDPAAEAERQAHRRGGRPRLGRQRHRRSRPGRPTVAAYLDYQGFAASRPGPAARGRGSEGDADRAPTTAPRPTYPQTIAWLEALFGVTVDARDRPEGAGRHRRRHGRGHADADAPRHPDARLSTARAAGPAAPSRSGDGRHPVGVRGDVARGRRRSSGP